MSDVLTFEIISGIRQLSDEEWQRVQEKAEDLRRLDAIHKFCNEQCSSMGPARDTCLCDPDCALAPHKPPFVAGGAA